MRILWIIVLGTSIAVTHATVDLVVTCDQLFKPMHRSVDLTVTTHLGAGFFTELAKVLASIIHYENEGFANVRIDWTYEFFPFKDEPHGNGWDLYFEPIQLDTAKLKPDDHVRTVGNSNTHDIHDQICSSPWLSYEQFLPYRTFVHQKINQYVRVKKDIVDQVDSFYAANMKDYLCIGVQVRFANAHIAEVPGNRHASLEEYFAEVDAVIRAHSGKNIKIYIASDSHYVVRRFKQRYGTDLVHIEAYRAPNNEDPGLIYGNADYWLNHVNEWHQKKPGYIGGLTTLLDCLLLARCDYFIHTTSNLANFVVFFKPTIKSVYVPRNAPYIPCRHKGDASVNNKFLNPI